MQKSVQKGTLEDLPVFLRFPMPDKQHDHARIFELALITLKLTPHTQPPYKIRESGGIIGRNPDSTVVYLAPKTMLREDGVYAYPDEIREINVSHIESYLILEGDLFRRLST